MKNIDILQIRLEEQVGRVLRSTIGFNKLTLSLLVEQMIIHCLNDEQLLEILIDRCKQQKKQPKAS